MNGLSSGDVVCIQENHVVMRARRRAHGHVGKLAVVLCNMTAAGRAAARHDVYVLIDGQLLELWVGGRGRLALKALLRVQ